VLLPKTMGILSTGIVHRKAPRAKRPCGSPSCLDKPGRVRYETAERLLMNPWIPHRRAGSTKSSTEGKALGKTATTWAQLANKRSGS
jgi:hypothetical protein